MSVRFALSIVLAVLAAPLVAGDAIVIHDAYIRSSTPKSPTGAAFMMIMNHGDIDDRLIGARTDIAARIELHSHTSSANGVMIMGKIEGGIALPAGAMHKLARGGDHLMVMGLKDDLVQGDTVTLILIFEQAGEISLQLPVDRMRMPMQGHSHSGG